MGDIGQGVHMHVCLMGDPGEHGVCVWGGGVSWEGAGTALEQRDSRTGGSCADSTLVRVALGTGV
jgi:hypothetical protein